MSLKISISGIRGVIGQGLDAESATRYASAYGNMMPKGPIVLARDSRPSGPMLRHAVGAALMSTGHEVVDAGVLSTPGTEYLVQSTDAVGGIILTASHNPIQWNALKLLRGDGLFLDQGEIDELLQRSDGDREHLDALSQGAWTTNDAGNEMHLQGILDLDFVDLDAVRRSGLKGVVDAVEGAGGYVVPELLRRMGVEVVELHCGMSGRFPHDPEPRPDHLKELSARVASEGADLGLAVDPDVDRLALVDKGGLAVSEERTLVVAADHVLARRKGPLVVNLSTTYALDLVAERHGVEIHRSAVGEANVVQRMLEVDAMVGGEGNGGVILPVLHPGRDAPLGAALVLAAVAGHGSLRACLDAYPESVMVKEKLELRPEIDDPEAWREALLNLGSGGRMDDTDGLKYSLGERWVHLRRSNTENALRIIAEAADPSSAQALVDEVRNSLSS